MKQLDTILLRLTVVLIALCLACVVCMQAPPFAPVLISYLYLATGIALVGLFFLNLGFAAFFSARRTAHLVASLFIILSPLAVVVVGMLLLPAQFRWFLHSGVHGYDRMLDKISREKAPLASTNRPLNKIVGRAYVWGKTNDDGSLWVQFQGRGNDMRHGYLYYSGDGMTTSPNNSNIYSLPENPTRYYFHMTNDWYSY